MKAKQGSISIIALVDLGLGQGFFWTLFLTNQLNWIWQFLSFFEILLEFFQNLA